MSKNYEKIIKNSYRPFGNTGLDVSAISFGGAGISGEGGGYGFGDISENNAIELVQYAYDLGINVFDTAPIYGFGESEKRLGKAIKGFREKVFVISKSGVGWHSNKRVDMNNDPKLTEKMLLESLKRMGTEYIDFYFIHWPDEKFDIRRPLEVLQKYKDKGVIRHIGLCNTNVEDLMKSKEVTKVEVVQSEYNMFMREVEKTIFPYLEEMAFMSWGTLEKGILTGNYDLSRKFDDSDARKKSPWWKKSDVEKKVHLVSECKEYLKETELEFRDLALGFNLNSSFLSTVLCGVKSKKHIHDLAISLEKKELVKSFESLPHILDHLQKFYK